VLSSHALPSLRPAAAGALPVAVVSPRAAQRLRQGHPLVARAELVTPPEPASEVVLLVEQRGGREVPLATGLWCPRGPIAARLWSRQLQALDRAELRRRLAAADARRQVLFAGVEPARTAYRAVHGEADQLPGLFVDRYADAAVLQTATAVMDARAAEVAELLTELWGARLVVRRDDGSARDLEELGREKGILLDRRSRPGAGAVVRFDDAGSPMEADLLADRKTGSFLDQQENHALAAQYARRLHPGGQALDAFCYHGGFALALARAGLDVLACDEDPQAVARARRNAALGGVRAEFVVHNAFDLLRSLEAAGRRFGVVSIDPPALAKRGARGPAGASAAAMRAYKELNLRALRLLAPGGLLVTSSCSGRVTPADFGAVIDEAARDVGRPVQILERRGAGRDHPVLCGLAESEYLKCWFLRALD
jgi:23S rRNA (cytosine1962-C5)-methyltransferase